jgi:hypothetical protein
MVPLVSVLPRIPVYQLLYICVHHLIKNVWPPGQYYQTDEFIFLP